MSFLIVTELVGTLFPNYARACEEEEDEERDKSRGVTFQRKHSNVVVTEERSGLLMMLRISTRESTNVNVSD